MDAFVNSNRRMTFLVSQFPAFESNILDSQVYSKAKLLTELGWSCQFVGTDIPERCTEQNIKLLQHRYGLSDVRVSPIYPKQPNFSSLASMLKASRIAVQGALFDWSPSWVYFRNLFEFATFHKMVRTVGGQCVYDVRATLSNEVRHKSPGFKGRMKELFVFHKERQVFRQADHMLCVSQHMKEWIAKSSGRMDAKVIPCCADHEQFHPDEHARLKLRAELGWSNDCPVIAYVGGSSYWQRPEDIVRLLGGLKGRIPQLKVLVLTGSVELFSAMFAGVGLSCVDVHIRNVPHGEVASWLNVADAGLVLRHDMLLNNVASPIKIGEYLATGLAVICTKGIGDYSQAISKSHAGVVLGKTLLDEELVELFTDAKRLVECRKNALSLSRFYSRSFERELFVEFLESAELGVPSRDV